MAITGPLYKRPTHCQFRRTWVEMFNQSNSSEPLDEASKYTRLQAAARPDSSRDKIDDENYFKVAGMFNVSCLVVLFLGSILNKILCPEDVPGRPRATTPAEDRFSSFGTKEKNQIKCRSSSGRRISATTVRNRLHNAGLYPVVSFPQGQRRKCWAREFFLTHQQWASVLFTDGSRFTMESDSGRLLIWREQRTRYHQSNTVERHSYRGGGILLEVWSEREAKLERGAPSTLDRRSKLRGPLPRSWYCLKKRRQLPNKEMNYLTVSRNYEVLFTEILSKNNVIIVDNKTIVMVMHEASHLANFIIDEAHFWLNGYVNKPNCRIWSEANPQVYVETPLHPEKLTVWCALWAGGIIGPYFLKNGEGHNVTVNGDRYRAMITNFFIPELNNHDVQELWFQQDGATCHTARATIDLLKDTFGDRLISRFGPVNWPPRSCDLTPLDYFLWGYVKPLVYVDKPQTLDHLEDNIRRVIADIRPQMLEKVIENWTSRLDYNRARRGSPMPEIIFKM
ncbi:transposable element Tc3 transposase [Trichonephila clavipes]|nr:transposable element Tc3 transposase [Trichonephila clavipes]